MMNKKAFVLCLALFCQLSFASTLINESNTDLFYRYQDINHHTHTKSLPPHQSVDLPHMSSPSIYLFWINKHNGKTYKESYCSPVLGKNDRITLEANDTLTLNGVNLG